MIRTYAPFGEAHVLLPRDRQPVSSRGFSVSCLEDQVPGSGLFAPGRRAPGVHRDAVHGFEFSSDHHGVQDANALRLTSRRRAGCRSRREDQQKSRRRTNLPNRLHLSQETARPLPESRQPPWTAQVGCSSRAAFHRPFHVPLSIEVAGRWAAREEVSTPRMHLPPGQCESETSCGHRSKYNSSVLTLSWSPNISRLGIRSSKSE